MKLNYYYESNEITDLKNIIPPLVNDEINFFQDFLNFFDFNMTIGSTTTFTNSEEVAIGNREFKSINHYPQHILEKNKVILENVSNSLVQYRKM